jgi:hypothetical protein
LPLPAIACQIEALQVLGTPKAYFDHDTVMFDQARRLGVRSFGDYVDALARAVAEGEVERLSLLVSMDDLEWLGREPAIERLLQRPGWFIRFSYRDPVLQAIRLMADGGEPGRTGAPPIDYIPFKTIADRITLLDDRESGAITWLSARDLHADHLTVEELSAPGVAALRHLLDDRGLALPAAAGVRSLDPLGADHLAAAQRFREEAKRRHWEHAIPLLAPHWERHAGLSEPTPSDPAQSGDGSQPLTGG